MISCGRLKQWLFIDLLNRTDRGTVMTLRLLCQAVDENRMTVDELYKIIDETSRLTEEILFENDFKDMEIDCYLQEKEADQEIKKRLESSLKCNCKAPKKEDNE